MIDSIFTPNFNITSKTKFYLEDIDRRVWLIDHMLIIPKHEAWMRREVSVRRAVGTTKIEGATLDEAAVSKLASQSHGAKYTEDEQANINALEAYEFIDFLSDQKDIPIDELVIRQLNRYFMHAAPETLTPGVYRRGQNTVGNFIPPDQGDVPGLMRSFALWLRDDEDDVHPVFKAAIAHIHLVAIHPFWDGNGRTARGLSTLMLQRSSFGFKKLLSLENYLSNGRDSYFTAIERALGTRFTAGYDATSWLEFFTLSLNIEAQFLEDRMTDWHRMMQDLHAQAATVGLLERQVDGHMFALQTGQITRSDYIEITGVSPVTASRDLAELVRVGALIPEGKTRTRVYRPAPKQPETGREIPEEQLPLLP